jgi:hypothetical protein
MKTNTLYQTEFPGLTLLSRGKVRDIYDLGDSLLMVATDRISAFDVIMDQPIPGKGKILGRDCGKPCYANSRYGCEKGIQNPEPSLPGKRRGKKEQKGPQDDKKKKVQKEDLFI